MICAFSKSRITAWVGGGILSVAAASIIWFIPELRTTNLLNRTLVASLGAFVAANLAVYAARTIAIREYQTCLLYLYEKLDPQKMLNALLPLQSKKIDASSRCTMLVHIANGYLYSGQPTQALEVLKSVKVPEKASEMRGLILGNQATCYLLLGNAERAQIAMYELKQLIAKKSCKKEFSLKARRTLAYLQMCLNILMENKADLKVLENDFQTSHSPLHKLDVQYYLAMIYCQSGTVEQYESSRAYILKNAGQTYYAQLVQQLKENREI